MPWLAACSVRKRNVQKCTLPSCEFISICCFLAWYLPLNVLRFPFFCTMLHAAILIGWLSTCPCHHSHSLRESSATSNMTNTKTNYAMQDSDYFVELDSMSAGMPLPFSTRSQVWAFAGVPVPVEIQIRVPSTGLAPTSTRILRPKPGPPPSSFPRNSSSS